MDGWIQIEAWRYLSEMCFLLEKESSHEKERTARRTSRKISTDGTFVNEQADKTNGNSQGRRKGGGGGELGRF